MNSGASFEKKRLIENEVFGIALKLSFILHRADFLQEKEI